MSIVANGSAGPWKCGIVLHPAGHTRSPAMHRAAYQSLGLNASYETYDVPPEGLDQAANYFRAEGIRQLAVSIPHKEKMMAFVDELEPVGRAIGAINTVTLDGDRWVGTNTDWIGALRAIERIQPISGQRAVVLGAGGTARALTFALRERDCEVFVLNRTVERAEVLARDLDATGTGGLDRLHQLAPDILVNTTSVGLNEDRSPVPADHLRENMVVLDAVYAPEQTRLLRDAQSCGAKTVGGKWMLVHQAVEQLRRWTSLLPSPPSEAALAEIAAIMALAFDEAGKSA